MFRKLYGFCETCQLLQLTHKHTTVYIPFTFLRKINAFFSTHHTSMFIKLKFSVSWIIKLAQFKFQYYWYYLNLKIAFFWDDTNCYTDRKLTMAVIYYSLYMLRLLWMHTGFIILGLIPVGSKNFFIVYV